MIGGRGLAEFYEARHRIAAYVRRTPLVHSEWLSRVCGAEVLLKLESLQITNSFKLRGAANAALRLSAGARSVKGSAREGPRLVTASAGNHGRALAYVSERLGLPLTVFTPRDAPRTKLEAMRRHGADLRDVADDYESAEHMAKAQAKAEGAVFLSPYSHPDVIAGAGTIALEIFEDRPDIELIVTSVGGGGLISGVATVTKGISPQVETVGVEAEASNAFQESVAAGRITRVVVGPTIADGLGGNMDPDTMTFDIVRRVVDRLVTVPEDALIAAIRGLVTEEHLIAEGAGAAAVAAVIAQRIDLRGRRTALVVSGSNIDATRLAKLLQTA